MTPVAFSLATIHVAQLSLSFVRVLTQPGLPHAFDSRRLLARRFPSAITDGDGVSPASRTLLQALAGFGTTREMFLSLRMRVPRCFVTPSGMSSIRRIVVPPSNIPSAFHASPPVGRLIPLRALDLPHPPASSGEGGVATATALVQALDDAALTDTRVAAFATAASSGSGSAPHATSATARASASGGSTGSGSVAASAGGVDASSRDSFACLQDTFK